ncbi:hypothetical protein LV779_07395 [Streptomyces thinghirensis]|nr:hypothetical protein [Streptomyces thinghirensis]
MSDVTRERNVRAIRASCLPRFPGAPGAHHRFGNPGSNELPFLAGLPDGFRYVLGLHEGAVVGMADGYAQATGRPVLVNLHAASGFGQRDGRADQRRGLAHPLVVVAGQQVRPAIGPEANLASVDAQTLMKPLVGWAAEPACAEDVPRARPGPSSGRAPAAADLSLRPLRRLVGRGR